MAFRYVQAVLRGHVRTDGIQQDFRSEEGLYSLIQAQRESFTSKKTSSRPADRQPLSPRNPTRSKVSKSPSKRSVKPFSIPSNIKGKDLFDSQLWKDPTSTSVFYKFIASLRRKIQDDISRTTSTHRFIRLLRDQRKLVRCYTQNIDGLEAREGLCTDMERSKGNRARFTKRSMEKPKAPGRVMPGGDLDGGCEVVQLHGDLEVLRCTLCQQTCPWNEPGYEDQLLAGQAPTCQSCVIMDLDRQCRGKRGTKIGTLRPSIVLYGEEHPSADTIGTISAHDLTLSPDLLLILGTSLHVHGLKRLVREFAKCVHARAGGKGKVVLVNISRPSESAWKDVFDYWVSMDCDEWVDAMRRHRSDMFQVQDELKLQVTKANHERRSKAISVPHILVMDEDKENQGAIQPPTPRKSDSQLKVLITPKKTTYEPKQVSSIIDQLEAAAVDAEKPNEQTQLDNQLQLPTPPSTAQRGKFQSPPKKRSLADNYQDMFNTPSKRKKSTLTVWEDDDAVV